MAKGASEQDSDLRKKIDDLQKDYGRLKWLGLVFASAVAAIFFAGYYLREASITYGSIQEILNTYPDVKKDVSLAKQEIGKADGLRNELLVPRADQRGNISGHGNSSEAERDALHHRHPIAVCPQGQYAAGVRAWGNKGGACDGCFNGIQVICRPILAK